MKRARIVTPWVGDGTMAAPYFPQLLDDYNIAEHVDVTAQPTSNLKPDPNAYTVEVVCTEAVLDQIEADGIYPVLWSEEVA